MNEKITTLVVTSDDTKTDSLRSVFGSLSGFDVNIESVKFGECVAWLKKTPADVAVVFLEEQPGNGCVILEEIKKVRSNIFAFAVSRERSADVIIKAIRAGADELLSAIPNDEEILKALVKVVERRRIRPHDEKPSSEVITVHSPHGGSGVTTIAINMALDLRSLTNEEVVLVDLDLQGGETPVYLNFQPSYNILDVCESIDGLDPILLKGSLHSHPSGLQILAPPTNLEDGEAVSPDHVAKILTLLKDMYRYVVVDTSAHLSETVLVALEKSDHVLLVTDNMVPSVRACQRTLDTLDRLGVDFDAYKVVLNKPQQRSEITAKDLFEALKCEVVGSLPFDDATAIQATNQGTPLREVNARSALTEAIEALVKRVAGLTPGKQNSRGLFGRLFSEARL